MSEDSTEQTATLEVQAIEAMTELAAEHGYSQADLEALARVAVENA